MACSACYGEAFTGPLVVHDFERGCLLTCMFCDCCGLGVVVSALSVVGP